MKLLAPILALFSLAAGAQTPQTWVPVAHEGDTVTFSSGFTVRYGAPQNAPAVAGTPCATVGGCWNTYSSTAAATLPVANGGVLGKDPIPGTVKELDVLETASQQVVTVNGKPVTVPALPHAVVLSAVPGQPCSSTDPTQCTATWFGAQNLPANGANDTWESPVFTITIDGAAWTCTYQPQSYTANQFAFSCTAGG